MLFSAMLFSSTVGYDNSSKQSLISLPFFMFSNTKNLVMNGVIALGQWEGFMNHPQGAHLGGIIAVQAAGSIIAFPIMSLLANKYGRKIPVYIGILIITFGVGLQTGSKNAGMFIASRFFVGTASGFLGCVPILVTEVAYPTHRGTITALYK
jgi:MFS family permease